MFRQYLTISLATFTALTAGQTCYNPDRTTASNAVPCSTNSTDTDTSCCDEESICLSSGYCLSVTAQPYTLYRGSCTDSAWSSFCAYYCVNYRTATNAPITNIGVNTDGRAIYCCGEGGANQTASECANGDPPFILEDAEMVFGVAALVDVSSSSSTGGDSTSGDGDGDDSNADESAQCSTCHSTAIDAGVGVPLGVLALSAIAWALVERRRRKGRGGKRVSPVEGIRGADVQSPEKSQQTQPTELDMSALSRARGDTLLHGAALSEMGGEGVRR